MKYKSKRIKWNILLSFIYIILITIGIFTSISSPYNTSEEFRFALIIVGSVLFIATFPLSFFPAYNYSINENELSIGNGYHITYHKYQISNIIDICEGGRISIIEPHAIPPNAEQDPKNNHKWGVGKLEEWIMLRINTVKGVEYIWISPIRKGNFIDEMNEINKNIEVNNSEILNLHYA